MATREKNLEAFLDIQRSVQQASSDLNDAERAVQKATRHVEDTRLQLDLALAGMKRLVEVLNLGTPLTVEQAEEQAAELIAEARAHARLQRELAAIRWPTKQQR